MKIVRIGALLSVWIGVFVVICWLIKSWWIAGIVCGIVSLAIACGIVYASDSKTKQHRLDYNIQEVLRQRQN
jgi:hypothetical protein